MNEVQAADECIDNDINAYSGKWRREYERLLNDIAARRIDSVIVWHLDRPARRPIELGRAIEVGTAAGVDISTVTGDVGRACLYGRCVRLPIATRRTSRLDRRKTKSRHSDRSHGRLGGSTVRA